MYNSNILKDEDLSLQCAASALSQHVKHMRSKDFKGGGGSWVNAHMDY